MRSLVEVLFFPEVEVLRCPLGELSLADVGKVASAVWWHIYARSSRLRLERTLSVRLTKLVGEETFRTQRLPVRRRRGVLTLRGHDLERLRAFGGE